MNRPPYDPDLSRSDVRRLATPSLVDLTDDTLDAEDKSFEIKRAEYAALVKDNLARIANDAHSSAEEDLSRL